MADPVFGTDRRAHVGRPFAHRDIADRGAHGAGQPFRRQPGARNGLRAGAQRCDALSPEGLIAKVRDGDRGYPGSQSRRRRSDAAVMDHGRHAREQPGMREVAQGQDRWRQAQLSRIAARHEVKSGAGWVRIRSGYFSKLSLTPDGRLAGLAR